MDQKKLIKFLQKFKRTFFEGVRGSCTYIIPWPLIDDLSEEIINITNKPITKFIKKQRKKIPSDKKLARHKSDYASGYAQGKFDILMELMVLLAVPTSNKE